MSPETEPIETPEAVETIAPATRRAMNPDRLAELEEERRFLLRSIADLERERAAGDVDEADYHALRDGYTARAANVLRAIDEGRSALPPKPPRNWKRLIAITAAVVAFGIVAGILVALNAGQRDPGDTITGGTSPNQVASLLSDAHALFLAGDFGDASERYLKVLDIEPDNVEALTYAGWVLAVSAQGQTAEAGATLIARAKDLLEQAIDVDSTYADPHCFLALIADQLEDDPDQAATRKAECLANDPSADMRALMDDVTEPTSTTG
jgi:tetratricopeptide (TPR) repeat protein